MFSNEHAVFWRCLILGKSCYFDQLVDNVFNKTVYPFGVLMCGGYKNFELKN